jgi:serine/threonine protein kinase
MLAGRYVLIERIASGGMGTVYRATDDRLGRTVAVKVLRDELAGDERFVRRFRREARSVAALSHPNIAAVFDYGEDERYFIVMEFVAGRDLSHLLKGGPLHPDRAAHIAAQTLNALGHAHRSGVVHRDVKPENIIIVGGVASDPWEESVKVTDFGIARMADDSTLTATGAVLGTAHYLSPEQAKGERVGPPSDIYSAGVVLYEMLVGEPPFVGDSPLAVAMRHADQKIPPVAGRKPDVPSSLSAIVARATAKEARARYSSADEMADNLRAASSGPQEGSGTDARPAKRDSEASGSPATGDGLESVERARREGGPTRPVGTGIDPRLLSRLVVYSVAVLVVIVLILLTVRVASAAQSATAHEFDAGGWGSEVRQPIA